MTMNGSWGYQKADDDWKSPKTVVRNLITCAQGGGNYLLNIGPKRDGSVPEESVQILTEVGKWMDKNGPTIYESEPCQPRGHIYASYTRRDKTLYMHVYNWPGETPASEWLDFFNPPSVLAIGGLRANVKSARLFASGRPVTFEQGDQYVRFTGLPIEAPDNPATVIAIECDSVPAIEGLDVRKNRKREGVGK
jgi:alpha-L-fucosidase